MAKEWLTRYASKVDCEKLEVTDGNVEGRVVVIRCKSEDWFFVSFLYSLVIPREDLSSVPIASEFEDVFVKVKGLLLHHEIEFSINLVEGAIPFIIPLRRMVPKEQRELEVQVRDLLGKGFIRRSVSEWDAPVVFATKADSS